MALWDEIKKLAADLHRIQLGESVKKLSERNCVEIVAGLIDNGLINVVYSVDGREYITREYLRTQILNETYANNGRISLVDLQQMLNVQYQTVENEAKFIVETHHDFTLCLGQLITRDYFNKIFKEINELLHEEGRLTFSDITKSYDLPTDMLMSEILAQLGGSIRASRDIMDGNCLYTDSYASLQKAILKGALIGLTRPTPIAKLVSEVNIETGLIFSCFDQLIAAGEVKGTLSGGRILECAVFIPQIFVESVERYVKDTYYQHNYVELASLKKLNIANASSYLQKLLQVDANALKFLKTYAISAEIYDQIENSVVEALKLNHWVDVSAHLPFSLNKADLVFLFESLHRKRLREWSTCCDSFFYVDELAKKFVKTFEPLIEEKAAKESPKMAKLLRSSTSDNNNIVETTRKNKTAGQRGKKGQKSAVFSSNAEQSSIDDISHGQQLEFMSEIDLVDYLKKTYESQAYPDELLKDVCEKISRTLNAKYRERLESVYLSAETINLKKSHGEFGDKFRLLYQNICLFDAGTAIFNDSVSEQLKIYLLRTLATDLVNLAVGYFANVPNASQMTPKIRDASIEEMGGAAKTSFQKLVGSLNEKNMNTFFDAVDEISAQNICSLNVKKMDKKVRSDLINRYQIELLSQLETCEDPSTGLLLSCLLLCTRFCDVMVHASGKFVPQIITILQEKIPKPLYTLLFETQKLVVKFIKNKDTTLGDELGIKFNDLRTEIKTTCSVGSNSTAAY